ncbi:MAG: CoA ester lyase [Anaerolineaceae bacterium]|nr:CoA ester lyase [Anaerolineaceae bacterium]
MHVRRALLYVPGDDRHKAEKAIGLEADCVCLDLEDGVAPNRKEDARYEVANSLNAMQFGHSEKLVRINSIPSGLCAQDLEAILPNKPDGVYLPKVSRVDEIQWMDEKVGSYEKRAGVNPGEITLVVGIESALGVLHLSDICQASTRLSALVFGAEDYIADIGGRRTVQGLEMLYARSALVTCAVAFGLQAIDMVCTEYKNVKRLLDESQAGMELGFTGKQVIHPDQVAPVQRAFTPDMSEIENAEKIVKAYQAHMAIGKGAFTLDDRMVDMPVVKAAERLLAKAGKIKSKGNEGQGD